MTASLYIAGENEIRYVIWESSSGSFSSNVKHHGVFNGNLKECQDWCKQEGWNIGKISYDPTHPEYNLHHP